MKLLVMGGIKGANVIKVLSDRFGSSIQYAREDYIENFDRVILRGDTFDRAIIFWHAINADGTITDTEKQRKLLANAIKIMRKEILNFELVFVADNESMARMILEETLDIKEWTVVLVKTPPMYVSFFVDLIKKELKEMDKSLVYSGDKIEKFMKKQGEDEEIIWSNWLDRTEGEVLSANIDIDLSSWGVEEDVVFSDTVHKDLKEKESREDADIENTTTNGNEDSEEVIDSSSVRESIKESEKERNKVKAVKEKKKKKILSFFR